MRVDLRTLSGKPVSRFAYGAMQWGDAAPADEARAMFDAARAAGITHFDTAFAYTDGQSETMLGALAAGERQDLFLATKARFDQPMTAQSVADSARISLDRLRTDQIDLFYLHRWDPATAVEETFDGLADLCEAGLIRHVGVSNFAAWQVMKAQHAAFDRGLRIDVIQPMLNLVKRQVEVELIPMAFSERIEIATYSPLAGGLLTGKYARGETGRLTTDSAYATRYGEAWMHAAARGLNKLETETGHDPAKLAVAWVAAHPAQVLPILSARSLDQLRPSLDAITFKMPKDILKRLNALSRAPAPATDRQDDR